MSKEIKNYNLVARTVHWVTALAIFAMFGLGLWMMDLNYYSSWYQTAPHWHKSVGMLLVLLTLFRIVWKWITTTPPIEGSKFEKTAAHIAHKLMYLLMILLFISGYLISTSDGRGIEVFNWFVIPSMGELFANQSDIAGQIHYYTAYTLIAFALLHAAAALKHHLIDKDNTLRKMLGASK